MKFLIADDDNDTREFLRTTLESEGHAVEVAANGKEALGMAGHSPPEIVISDILMPEMDGFMLCREIKGDANLRNIPFVFYSGTYMEPEHEKLALALGASAFFQKPMEPAAFLDALEGIISQYQKRELPLPDESLEDSVKSTRMHEDIVVRKLSEKVRELEREITKRKHADTLVRILSQAIEQAGESILITDREGIIEYVNPAFTNLTGYTAEEAIGQTPRILQSGNQDDAYYEAMWKTITSGKVWHSKVTDQKKDGSFYPTMLTISPILDQPGDATCYSHFVAIHSDLTKLDDMERQFHQAQKMEAIGTLVGGIAHDFNNMLAGMAGNLYLLKKKLQEHPDAVQKLANVEALSYRAAEMIQQLLAFARKGQVSMKQLPFTPFTKKTLKLLRTSVPENIDMHQNICTEALPIHGDGTQLHQILMNLVNNASDALENADNPRISIRLEAFQPDEAFLENRAHFRAGRYAYLSVEDNGCGIPQHQIEHLFEPFFTTKEVGKGTGLGLAMVYGAIQSHQGFVEVESIEGEGSTFHIYLPLLESKDVVSAAPRGEELVEGQGETILLVDDDAEVRSISAEVLKSLLQKSSNRPN
ncbi:MAG: ATP-binding protein [Mariprofundaceae bacterium]